MLPQPIVGRRAIRRRERAEPVCNLYSMTRAQDAMRKLFGVKNDRTGNLPSLPGIFPDYLAPVVRVDRDGERVMDMMRWGFPPPPNLGTRASITILAPWEPFL